MCFNVEKKTPISRKSPRERHKKCQLDNFYWWSSDFLTHIIAHKSAKKTHKNCHWPNPHATEVEGKGVETSLWILIQINSSENLKQKQNLGSIKALKAHIVKSIIIFPIDKCNSI